MPANAIDLSLVFQALTDATRRGVIEQLGRGPATVSELAAPYDMALPSFVQHLRVLEASGLITSHKTGRVRTCQLAPDALAETETYLAQLRKNWETRLDQLDDYLHQLDRKERADER